MKRNDLLGSLGCLAIETLFQWGLFNIEFTPPFSFSQSFIKLKLYKK